MLTLAISIISLLVATASLGWAIHRSRAERRTDVRVLTRHDGAGIDIYSPAHIATDQVVSVRVVNHGERAEHVTVIGLETPSGERLVDDSPKAPKIIDEPAPEARELPPRGQLARQFHLPQNALVDGFVAFAILGTGIVVYSVPAETDRALGEVEQVIATVISGGPTTDAQDAN